MTIDDTQITPMGWLWRIALALVGCIVGGYVFDQVIGGGALGWTVTVPLVFLFCWPLLKPLLERNRRLHGKKKP